MTHRLIAGQYDTDKSQLYLNNYERYFGPLSTLPIRLLELGVHHGGSLLMWRDFFKQGDIVGLDLNRVEIGDSSGRIHVYQGDQRDRGLLDRIGRERASEGFDIIIDDASHIGEFTRISFWHLFDRHLRAGGVYVLEDWRVGYWGGWPDGAQYRPPDSTATWIDRFRRKPSGYRPSHSFGMVGLVKELVDELGMDAITNPARNGLAPLRLPKFQKMEICPGQVFVTKVTADDDVLIKSQLAVV